MYKKIVVCVDETPLSEQVTRVAGDLALRYGASVVLLSVVDSARLPKPPHSGLEAVQMLERHSRSLSNQTHRMGEMLNAMGVENREFVLPGRSAQTILQTAESEFADMIVIGTAPRGRLSAWLLNDLWSEVSHKAPCNVLRVTPGDPLPGSSGGGTNAEKETAKSRGGFLTTSISAL